MAPEDRSHSGLMDHLEKYAGFAAKKAPAYREICALLIVSYTKRKSPPGTDFVWLHVFIFLAQRFNELWIILSFKSHSTRPVMSTFTGSAFQMSRQYSFIARSEENFPIRAVFRTDIRVQRSLSR
jgi:hypothetical protein